MPIILHNYNHLSRQKFNIFMYYDNLPHLAGTYICPTKLTFAHNMQPVTRQRVVQCITQTVTTIAPSFLFYSFVLYCCCWILVLLDNHFRTSVLTLVYLFAATSMLQLSIWPLVMAVKQACKIFSVLLLPLQVRCYKVWLWCWDVLA